jgi:hypothetical protein
VAGRPRFTTRHERTKHAAVVNEAMRALLADMTMRDAIAHFTRHDVVAAPVNTIPQAAQDAHPWERRAMVEVPDFLAGTIAVSGDFWHFSRSGRRRLHPKVGSTTRRSYGLLGYAGGDGKAVRQRRDRELGPLQRCPTERDVSDQERSPLQAWRQSTSSSPQAPGCRYLQGLGCLRLDPRVADVAPSQPGRANRDDLRVHDDLDVYVEQGDGFEVLELVVPILRSWASRALASVI